MYRPNRSMPSVTDPSYRGWLLDELTRIAGELTFPEYDSVLLAERNVEPTKLYEGLTVLADGTNWNPGSGQGVYTYYGAAWHKLG